MPKFENSQIMIRTTQETKLQAELQELYLKSKQRISDLQFIHTEILSLKALFKKTASAFIQKGEYETIAEVLIKVISVENDISDFNAEVIRFRKTLEPLIFEAQPALDLISIHDYNNLDFLYKELMEKYSFLKIRLSNLEQ